MAAGGEILAPGPPDSPLQYIDARDLAAFVLDAAVARRGGPYNVVSRRGHATMGSLLEACRTIAGADAWSWLSTLDGVAPLREDRPRPGLDPSRERATLATWHRSHPD
jgi:nucleoside-diphosphate-sugar epimerase